VFLSGCFRHSTDTNLNLFISVLFGVLALLLFMKTHLRAVVLGMIVLVGMSQPGSTAHSEEAAAATQADTSVIEADVFITDLVDKLRILASEGDETAEGKDALRALLAEDMATRRLQAYLLSRQQRKSLSEAQIAEYNQVFPLYISAAFAASIDQLVSRTIKVNDVIERRPGDYIVRSKLFSSDGRERASLDWRVLESKSRKQHVD